MNREISAIICTHNKASYLRKSLASLVCQTLSKERFEVIVVDNCSTDVTRKVTDEFYDSLHLRYVYEPVLGLSMARNTGWRNTRCEFVAYLDDDAVAGPEWLERILDRFRRLDPTPASVGGKVAPIWEGKRPDWLRGELERYLSIVNWTEKACFLGDEGFYLAGCNIAYGQQVLDMNAGFLTHLGRRGHTLLSNEELWMQHCLKRRGLCHFLRPGYLRPASHRP